MVKLIKKLILVLSFHGLSEAAKAKKQTDIANAHQANPTLVPGLTPTPASVLTMITNQNNYYTQRDSLMEQMKQVTENIHNNGNAINNIFVDQWRPQTQVAINGDASKAKLLGYGIKSIDSGHTPLGAEVAIDITKTSHPVIVKIDVNTHDLHILHIHNNLTGKRRLPAGMLRIDIYGYTGAAGLVIADLAALIALGGGYLGEASRGKFVNTFTSNTGKTEYYVAVYVDKKTKKPASQSPVASGIIN
jgi:hypothetical protein